MHSSQMKPHRRRSSKDYGHQESAQVRAQVASVEDELEKDNSGYQQDECRDTEFDARRDIPAEHPKPTKVVKTYEGPEGGEGTGERIPSNKHKSSSQQWFRCPSCKLRCNSKEQYDKSHFKSKNCVALQNQLKNQDINDQMSVFVGRVCRNTSKDEIRRVLTEEHGWKIAKKPENQNPALYYNKDGWKEAWRSRYVIVTLESPKEMKRVLYEHGGYDYKTDSGPRTPIIIEGEHWLRVDENKRSRQKHDSNGNPLFNDDGTPKLEPNYLVSKKEAMPDKKNGIPAPLEGQMPTSKVTLDIKEWAKKTKKTKKNKNKKKRKRKNKGSNGNHQRNGNSGNGKRGNAQQYTAQSRGADRRNTGNVNQGGQQQYGQQVFYQPNGNYVDPRSTNRINHRGPQRGAREQGLAGKYQRQDVPSRSPSLSPLHSPLRSPSRSPQVQSPLASSPRQPPTQAPPMKIDGGQAFTRLEFLQFYGEQAGNRYWEIADPADVTQQPRGNIAYPQQGGRGRGLAYGYGNQHAGYQ